MLTNLLRNENEEVNRHPDAPGDVIRGNLIIGIADSNNPNHATIALAISKPVPVDKEGNFYIEFSANQTYNLIRALTNKLNELLAMQEGRI